jgi:hypothetical protein
MRTTLLIVLVFSLVLVCIDASPMDSDMDASQMSSRQPRDALGRQVQPHLQHASAEHDGVPTHAGTYFDGLHDGTEQNTVRSFSTDSSRPPSSGQTSQQSVQPAKRRGRPPKNADRRRPAPKLTNIDRRESDLYNRRQAIYRKLYPPNHFDESFHAWRSTGELTMPVSTTPINMLPRYLNIASRDQAMGKLEDSVTKGKNKLDRLAREGASREDLQKAHHAVQVARVKQIDNSGTPTLSLPPRRNLN